MALHLSRSDGLLTYARVVERDGGGAVTKLRHWEVRWVSSWRQVPKGWEPWAFNSNNGSILVRRKVWFWQ